MSWDASLSLSLSRVGPFKFSGMRLKVLGVEGAGLKRSSLQAAGLAKPDFLLPDPFMLLKS